MTTHEQARRHSPGVCLLVCALVPWAVAAAWNAWDLRDQLCARVIRFLDDVHPQ